VSAPSHSEPPFKIDHGRTGYQILDRFGNSICLVPRATIGADEAEQLANAKLFTAAPALLAAAKLGRAAIAQDRLLTIESATVPRPDTLEPDLSTLDEDAAAIVAELDLQLAQIDAAIAAAGALS
jgi:hypothetical protein